MESQSSRSTRDTRTQTHGGGCPGNPPTSPGFAHDMTPGKCRIDIQRLAAHEGPRLRAIRLRALAEAPDAFGSTCDEAAALPLDSWTEQLQSMATFAAIVDGEDVGLVRGARDDARTDAAWLISMWVAPEVRGQGVGEALVGAVVEWARAGGARRLLLDVGDHNRPAIALYARMGFEPNGTTGSLPAPRSHIREHQRELRL